MTRGTTELTLAQVELISVLQFFFSLHREGEKPKNPMVELFYGRFLAVGVLEGEGL